MDATENTAELSLKKSDFLVQPLAYKSIAYLEDQVAALSSDLAHKSEGYCSRISFIWSFQVKDIALLFRDSAINLLKLEQFHKDGIKTKEEISSYQDQLSEIVNVALSEVSSSYKKCVASNEDLNQEWQHQSNPAPVIIEQVHKVIDQIKTIQRSQIKLDKLNDKFDDYRSSYLDYMDQRQENSQQIQEELADIKKLIDTSDDDISKLTLTKIDSQIQSSIEKIENNTTFAPYQFIVLEDTDKLKLAIDADSGQLIYKTIDILSEVSGWVSFNITSPLKIIDTTLQTYKGRILVGLIQLSNRIKAKFESATEEEEITLKKNLLLTPLSRMISEYQDEIKPNDLEKLNKLKASIKSNITGSQLFNENYNFLPSSAIGQLTGFAEKSELQRRYNPNRIKNLVANYWENLFTNYSKNEQITAAGFINNIISFDTESEVNALFLKNGFLGSSFSVDRPEIMFRIDNHFRLWKKGFGGALLITGKHLSGRSTVLEMLPINYPETTSYHIIPGQKIDINGHKTLMTDDLLSTLEFIIKHKGSDKCMVTIDDVSYYASHPEETFQLFTNLNRFIIKHSKQIYFALVVHEFLHDKLGNFFELKNIFTEVVNTNQTPTEQIDSAVLTRAHAVANNDEVSAASDALASLSRRISRKANENIGRGMLLWCIKRGENYRENLSSTKFKELIQQHAPLLRTLIMHGAVSHPKLCKMLNEVDGRQLTYDINGLILIKLLVRPKEGYITINSHLKTFVEDFLV